MEEEGAQGPGGSGRSTEVSQVRILLQGTSSALIGVHVGDNQSVSSHIGVSRGPVPPSHSNDQWNTYLHTRTNKARQAGEQSVSHPISLAAAAGATAQPGLKPEHRMGPLPLPLLRRVRRAVSEGLN